MAPPVAGGTGQPLVWPQHRFSAAARSSGHHRLTIGQIDHCKLTPPRFDHHHGSARFAAADV